MQSCVYAAWEGKEGGYICTYCHRWSQVEGGGGRGTCTATDDCYLKNGILCGSTDVLPRKDDPREKGGGHLYTAIDDPEKREGGIYIYCHR